MTVQAQTMTVQANRDIAACPHKQVTTMDSRLREFSQINPPTFYGSKVYEYPQEFMDEVYMMLYDMGMSSSEQAKFGTYQLKDVVQTWYMQ